MSWQICCRLGSRTLCCRMRLNGRGWKYARKRDRNVYVDGFNLYYSCVKGMRTVFLARLSRRVMAFTGICSGRCNLRACAQSSTVVTP